MKLINLFLTICVFMTCLGCIKDKPKPSEDKTKPSKDKIIGTWVEKYHPFYDGFIDTIIFTEDFLVKKYFPYHGYKYSTSPDTISFQKDTIIRKCRYTFENENEITIYNFLDRSITTGVKDIQFTKISVMDLSDSTHGN